MEFKDVEFKEGIHKSVRKVPSEAENEAVPHGQDAATTPVSEASSASMPPPMPTNSPGGSRGRYRRGWQILAFALIVCIIGGSILVFLKLHTTQPASMAKLPTPTPSLKFCFCVERIVPDGRSSQPIFNAISNALADAPLRKVDVILSKFLSLLREI